MTTVATSQAELVRDDSGQPVFTGYIDKGRISQMLQAFGVDMTHPLAPAFVLGAFDVMAVADLATTLPEPMSLENAARAFHTMTHAQPVEVREVQVLVLERLRSICSPMSDDRYQVIRGALAVELAA